MIKVGLIGLGYWGSKLYEYFTQSGLFNVTVVKHYDDINSAIKNVDAVMIATPNNTHYELTKLALENGKHVMCEKPLAFTYAECRELQKLAESKGVQLAVEYTFTFSETLKLINPLCPNYIRMVVNHLGRFGGDNVYWLLGSHMLSVLDMFYPLEDMKYKKYDLLVHDDVVESGLIIFWSDDVNGVIDLSLNHPYKNVEIVFYYDTEATIIYNPAKLPPLESYVYERVKWNTDIPIEKLWIDNDESHNLRHAVRYFYDVITGQQPSNIERAVKVTKVLEDIQE